MAPKARDTLLPPFLRRAGRWALVAGVLGIIGFGTLFTFFAVGPPFGLVNDVLAIPGLLVLLPVGWALHRIGRNAAIAWSRLAFGALLAGVASVAALQLALISGILPFQEQLMCGIQYFEALIGDQLLTVSHYVKELKEAGFEGIQTLDITPTHAIVYGRK